LRDYNYENGTINNTIKSIRFFYRWLIDRGLYKAEKLEDILKIKLLKEPIRVHEYIDEGELKDLISMGMSFCYFMDPYKLKTILLFMYYTGLRKQEIVNLKRENFDFDKMTVYVKGKTKNRREREVPITKKLVKIIKEYFNKDKEVKNAFNVTGAQLRHLIKDLQDFMPSGRRLTVHMFRHSYGRMLARNKINVRIAQKLLGHKSIHSTLIYYDVTIDEAKQAYWEKFG
jgi:integrase